MWLYGKPNHRNLESAFNLSASDNATASVALYGLPPVYIVTSLKLHFRASPNATIPTLPIRFHIRYRISMVQLPLIASANAIAPTSPILLLLILHFLLSN